MPGKQASTSSAVLMIQTQADKSVLANHLEAVLLVQNSCRRDSGSMWVFCFFDLTFNANYAFPISLTSVPRQLTPGPPSTHKHFLPSTHDCCFVVGFLQNHPVTITCGPCNDHPCLIHDKKNNLSLLDSGHSDRRLALAQASLDI